MFGSGPLSAGLTCILQHIALNSEKVLQTGPELVVYCHRVAYSSAIWHVTNNTCVKRNIFKILPQSDWLFQQLKTTKATAEKLTCWLLGWCWFVLDDQGATHLPYILWCSSKSFTWNRRNLQYLYVSNATMLCRIAFSVKQTIKWWLVTAETNSCCTPMSQQQWLSRLKRGPTEPGAH